MSETREDPLSGLGEYEPSEGDVRMLAYVSQHEPVVIDARGLAEHAYTLRALGYLASRDRGVGQKPLWTVTESGRAVLRERVGETLDERDARWEAEDLLKRKCDECPEPATRGRIVYRSTGPGTTEPDYAAFACDRHGHPDKRLWSDVAHAARWENSDSADVDAAFREGD